MRYKEFDQSGEQINLIEIEPDKVAWYEEATGHKLQLLSEDLPPHEPTEIELIQQEITELHLELLEQGQTITDMELQMLGGESNV